MTPQQRFDSIVSALGEPFYTDGKRAVYCGDCRPLLPRIEPGVVDLVLTDPPYGMDYKPKRGADGSKRWTEGVKGDDQPFDPLSLLAFTRVILWGANWYADRLPRSGGWIVWDKVPNGRKEGFIASDCELAWTNVASRVHKYALQWGGEARNGEAHFHPTQKPLALMRWALERFGKDDDLILDPFAGSGTTLRAAKDLDRYAIGIEIDRRYAEIAAKRLRQGVLEFDSAEAIA